ncbi:LuxR family transcriptional regulator [Nonomuraea deserti]|uniref:LuxR family transcriptional regulator n=1 Tax=Nonomuraea deserti TaxID=1848322 RepID=A0A4R4U4S3_9ACTN|nr:LuxR family transcriptional regulator [Nonomuraea deserti]
MTPRWSPAPTDPPPGFRTPQSSENAAEEAYGRERVAGAACPSAGRGGGRAPRHPRRRRAARRQRAGPAADRAVRRLGPRAARHASAGHARAGPRTPVAYTPGALVIRQQSLITTLIDLFEQTWAREVTEPAHRLTPREREVLALIAEGRSNSAVARALSITEAAVGKHVAGVFAKLELPATEDDNRRVLAVLAYLRGAVR